MFSGEIARSLHAARLGREDDSGAKARIVWRRSAERCSGMIKIIRYPRIAAAIASAIPVLPWSLRRARPPA